MAVCTVEIEMLIRYETLQLREDIFCKNIKELILARGSLLCCFRFFDQVCEEGQKGRLRKNTVICTSVGKEKIIVIIIGKSRG